mmetsp:Transcript_247/g.589  ORF Transcript_247/g.589 Transcript_247/m.589 type:complete len:381 (+) Transcript_247:126-1268(+)
MNTPLVKRPVKYATILITHASASSSRSTSNLLLRSKHLTNGLGRYFATNTKQGHKPKYQDYRSVFVVATTVVALSASLYTRHLREQKLSTLTLAKDCGLLSAATSSPSTTTTSSSQKKSIINPSQSKYSLPSLMETITRAGLLGSTKSVKDEIHVLRKWHANRGYNGGIVVRDLSRPLFSLNFGHETNDEVESTNSFDDAGGGNMSDTIDVDHTNQRECYYLYYEIHSNGKTQQQIFCRGTTLFADVLTCLQTWFVYDEELGCRVHHGFNQHANRIVEDVLPLLVPPRGSGGGARGNHATVEVCGHSLGGAVAMLVAIKLKKRGYFVTRVTSLAGPRFCRGVEERKILQAWLPEETINIENDLDVVTYLPFRGVLVGDRL